LLNKYKKMIYVIIFGSIRCRFTLNLPIAGLFTEENRSVTNGTRIEKIRQFKTQVNDH